MFDHYTGKDDDERHTKQIPLSLNATQKCATTVLPLRLPRLGVRQAQYHNVCMGLRKYSIW